jgi:hypothetical protein
MEVSGQLDAPTALPRVTATVPTVQEDGWEPETLRTLRRRDISPAPTGGPP